MPVYPASIRAPLKTWTDKPARRAQKDTADHWTMKRGRVQRLENGTPKGAEIMVPTFGYKNHIATDRRHGLIRRGTVTHAAAYDGRRLGALLDPNNTASDVWADTAYRSKENEKRLSKRGLISKIHFKKPIRKPLLLPHKKAHADHSKVHSAVEHLFAHLKGYMKLFIRTIGIERYKVQDRQHKKSCLPNGQNYLPCPP